MKSNGILFAALISNFAFIRSYAAREPENLIGLKAEMKATMNHGFVTHVLDFPGAFFIYSEQIIRWMEDQGFRLWIWSVVKGLQLVTKTM